MRPLDSSLKAVGPADDVIGVMIRSGASARMDEAERLLLGLATPGSTAHDALTALHDGSAVSPAELVDALAVVAEQARISRRAGEYAATASDGGPHWLVPTAREWQCYLRWLLTRQHAMARHVDGMADDDRTAVLAAWTDADRECAGARQTWGALVPEARRPA